MQPLYQRKTKKAIKDPARNLVRLIEKINWKEKDQTH